MDFVKATEKQVEYKGLAGLRGGIKVKSYSTKIVSVGSKSVRAINSDVAMVY